MNYYYGLKLKISNPDAIIMSTDDGVWVIEALDFEQIKEYIEANRNFSPETIFSKLTDCLEEATLIRLNLVSNRVTTLYIYKSFTSKYDIYYLRTGDDYLLLTDHFRNAISALPLFNRTVLTENVVDHFLFPSLPGVNTHLSEIKRIGSGVLLSFTGEGLHSERIYNIQPRAVHTEPDQAIELVDAALNKIIGKFKQRDNVVNMLSGGVDSTLIQTYLNADVTSMSVAFDSPEFAGEIEYARKASSLLNTNHKLVTISENDYYDYLVSSIENLAQPFSVPQLPLFDIAFGHTVFNDYNIYISGDFVGYLFGTGADEKLLDNLRYFNLVEFDRELPELSKHWLINSDLKYTSQLFGESCINNRFKERIDYVRKRFESKSISAVEQYMEYYSMLKMLHDNNQSLWHQLAFSYRKVQYTPFSNGSLLKIMLSVPVLKRYSRKGQYKYILKSILKKRLPVYPIDKPKLGTGLPRTRYCQEGPLKGFFNSYSIPDCIEPDFYNLVLDPQWETSWLTYNAITYTIWLEKVLKNPNIKLVPDTISLEWRFLGEQ